ARELAELFEQRRMLFELAPVAALELVPAGRIVAEPLPQLGAGSDLLEPQVDMGAGLRHAARPEPIDQHSRAVTAVEGVVDAFDANLSRSHAVLHRLRRQPGRPANLHGG